MNQMTAITDSTAPAVSSLMSNFSIEVVPGSASKIKDFREYLRPNTRVYVTSLMGADFADTISVCKKLRDDGMYPVPHFAARGISSKKILEDNLARITAEAGVDAVLAIAGANKKPVGELSDSMAMLETGLFDKYGIASIGVAGHPEGSPDMCRDSIKSAGYWKNDFANQTDANMYLITQFIFDAQPVIDWLERIKNGGNKLPVVVGIPGLATLKSLVGHAKACGIGPSMTVLMKQAKNIHKLMTLQTPDKLLLDLANYKSQNPDCGLERIHVYPLGGMARSAEWSNAVSDGDLEMQSNGFKVNQ